MTGLIKDDGDVFPRGECGTDLDRAEVMRDRVLFLAGAVQCAAEVIVGVRKVGREPTCLFKKRDRF
jgi:hypothetical protein